MLSVVIPARNEQFLQNTIDDLLSHAEGEIEVIAVLDGYWPDPALKDDPRVKIIHRGVSHGMRAAINAGVALSKGEYILKIDAHCMVGQGFDKILIADCEDDWVVVPRRKRLDAENWCIQDCGKPDIDYMFLSAPTDPNDFGGAGLHGKLWEEKNRDPELKKVEIDDLMSFQGSAWFMKKSYFYFLELMDEDTYGGFAQEAPEIGLKAWLSGGRVIVNKKTWYAHLHKGKKYGRGYRLSNESLIHGNEATNRFITGKAWHKQIHDLKWLVEKFSPCPTWEGFDWDHASVPKEKFLEPLPHIKKKFNISNFDIEGIVPIDQASREDLAELLGELSLNYGAEIGVESGRYSKVLLEKNKGLKLYGIDWWEPYEGYREHVTMEKYREIMDKAHTIIGGRGGVCIKKRSMDAISDFEDSSLDFVYIDANHTYEAATEDIREWSKKVRPGGIVAGHDYVNTEGYGVIQAIHEHIQEKGIKTLFITSKDRSPSWFYIKPL